MTDSEPVWKCARGPVPHAGAAGVMAVVNLTSDSFYPPSRAASPEDALARALRLLGDGADVLDVGAESTRPGARPVPSEVERERILPLLDALMASESPPLVSVDTRSAATAEAALEHGAAIVNDVSGLSLDPRLLAVVAERRPGYVLTHSQGTPETMQDHPSYRDVLDEVAAFFERGLERLAKAGLPEDHVILDPGIGFGKRAGHNLALMEHPEAWARLGRPSLMALSMKSVFGDVLGLPLEERGEATRIATALAFRRGYLWHRVHDAAAARRALALAAAMRDA